MRLPALERGDSIATGQPGGDGGLPGTFRQDGDEVVVQIDGIGEIRHAARATRR